CGSAPATPTLSDRAARTSSSTVGTARRPSSCFRASASTIMFHSTLQCERREGVFTMAGGGEGEDMLIVDAQIHLWNAGNPTSPWHRQVPAYLKDEALTEMDAGGVDAALLTPHTPWDPNANELCIGAAPQAPRRFAIL